MDNTSVLPVRGFFMMHDICTALIENLWVISRVIRRPFCYFSCRNDTFGSRKAVLNRMYSGLAVVRLFIIFVLR